MKSASVFRATPSPGPRGTWGSILQAMVSVSSPARLISQPGFFGGVTTKVDTLVTGIMEVAKAAGIPMTENHVGGMFGLFFTEADKVSDFAGTTACDQERFKAFFHGMLEEGVYLAPSAFEAGFVSAAHTYDDLTATIQAAERVFARIA